MKSHKHADLIKAWADGAEIERFETDSGTWLDSKTPIWSENTEYRIKPNLNSEKVLSYLRLTFNKKTGKLESAEVVNNAT